MKISVALVTFCLLIALTAHAASHRPDQSRLHLGVFLNYGSGAVTAGQGFAVDDAQNYYVSGHWVGESQFGGEVVKSSGLRTNQDNVYLARYSCSGEFLGVRPYQKGDADFSNIVRVEMAGGRAGVRTPPNELGDVKESLSTCQAAIHAALSGAPVPPSNTPSVTPMLQVVKSGGFAVLYWPTVFAGFKLESSEALAPFPTWEPVVMKPGSTGAYLGVAIPITGSTKFFRLRSP